MRTFYLDEIEAQDWTCEDEAWMHELRDERELEREQRHAAHDYSEIRNARNGEKVRLLVPHPFQHDVWTIQGPAQEPGYFNLACRFQLYEKWNGFEQVFHDSEFETI